MIPIRDTIPSRIPPIGTWMIIIANAVVFFFELSLGSQRLEQLLQTWGVVPVQLDAALRAPNLAGFLPIFTGMFLHSGWLHIGFNMWTLWIFGDNVEDRMGHVRFLVFYFVCGIASAIFHSLLNAGSTLPAVGASGAIAGVLGAYLFLFPRARVIVLVLLIFIPYFLQVPAVFFLGIWFLVQLFSGALSIGLATTGGVAWWAHVGGFGAGVLLHRLFVVQRRPMTPDEYGIEGAWGGKRRGPFRSDDGRA